MKTLYFFSIEKTILSTAVTPVLSNTGSLKYKYSIHPDDIGYFLSFV